MHRQMNQPTFAFKSHETTQHKLAQTNLINNNLPLAYTTVSIEQGSGKNCMQPLLNKQSSLTLSLIHI